MTTNELLPANGLVEAGNNVAVLVVVPQRSISRLVVDTHYPLDVNHWPMATSLVAINSQQSIALTTGTNCDQSEPRALNSER